MKATRILSTAILAMLFCTPVAGNAETAYFSSKTYTADGGFIMSGSTAWQGETPPDACFSRFNANSQELWQTTLGGSNIDDGLRATEALDGNTIVLMSTDSTDGDMVDNMPYADFNFSYRSVLFKLDDAGSIIWKCPIWQLDRYASNVVAANDGYLVTGQTYADTPWVSFVDDSGKEQWQMDYPELEGGMFYGTHSLANGDILHVGRFFTPIPDSNFHTGEGWIVRTSATGALLWSQRYSESDYDAFNGATELDDGNLLLCGVIAPSIFVLSEEMETLPWVLKTTAEGDLLWSKALADSNAASLYDVRQVENGFEIGASRFGFESYAHYTIHIDSEGNLL